MGTLKGRNRFEDVGIDGRAIVKEVLKYRHSRAGCGLDSSDRGQGCLSQWSCSQRHGSVALYLLELQTRIPLVVWMSVSLSVLCVLRYRSLSQANHPSRGVVTNVVCLILIVKPQQGKGTRTARGCSAIGVEVKDSNIAINFDYRKDGELLNHANDY